MIDTLDKTILEWFQSIQNDAATHFLSVLQNWEKREFCGSSAGILMLVFLKDEEVWRDRTAFLAVLPDFWKWSAEKSGRQTRPCHRPHDYFMLITIPKDYSFPSGHTFSSVAAAIGIWHWNRKWGIAAVVTAILMMFSRLYFYVHYPTDISWWNPSWNGACPFEYPDCGKDIGQREMEELEK